LGLANLNIDALRDKVTQAYNADDPILQRFREYARRLSANIRRLRKHSVNAVSFVSADGGDNRLTFNPAVIELVRVVDSRGVECALDAIGSHGGMQELRQRAQPGNPKSVAPLERLCASLGTPIEDLSYLLRGIDDPVKSTGAIRTYRDIVEWAVLHDLVCNPNVQWGSDTIIVRDGLLRSKSFKREIFPRVDQLIRSGVTRHLERNVVVSVVGVAKQSAVLSRLAVALEIEGTFHRSFPCFVEIPSDIEAECYNFDRTWLTTYETSNIEPGEEHRYQSMGKLYLVKFGDRPLDPVWPVDIASWQVDTVERVLGQLTEDAQQGFPIPDYPMCIQRAHDFAKITGFEIEVLQDILLQGMTQNLTPEQTDRLLRLKYLGQTLAALRYKEA